MSGLEFLSPGLARADSDFAPVERSPLERALGEAARWESARGIRDLSSTGKLEVGGGVDGIGLEDAAVVRITPDRALLLCPPEDVGRHIEQLRARERSVVDVTSALAGMEVTGERLLRRLTDLDLDALPATGMVARVPATLFRHEAGFRFFFPQEYADYVADVVLDALAGLA